MRYEDLPYRPCVGVLVLNRAGLGFIGRRIEGPEHIDATHAWQMPQGGIDKDEEPWPAALRELHEDTNISSIERLGENADWLRYTNPHSPVGPGRPGKYPNQTLNRIAIPPPAAKLDT